MLDFVDECTGLNAEDDSIRRRTILLFRKLFEEESLRYDDSTMQVFFDIFIERLSDFNVTEEVLRTLIAIATHYPAVGEVICNCGLLSVAVSKETLHIPHNKYKSGYIQVFLSQARLFLDYQPSPLPITVREPGRYSEGDRECTGDSPH